ncbi:hypothetical protein HUG15_02260 [Salicibibacter cibarius]|uniref:Uncharacterized protein n=2 Tax=Salicibibacter TaxID=2685905 RepID=A0A514LJG5_9BACI|nr:MULTISPECIES: hypothetical protein [Salicibibacter]QDI92006.1 hypothetical protein EPH95_13140 [Salicibibacter halophilus]QQK74541.1 hypothetical protein HUG15_02260 [Salicibibacter cibarius]
MNPVAERLIVLVLESDKRTLTQAELVELNESKQYFNNFFWEYEKLNVMSYVASETDDYKWQHDILERVEQLKGGRA